MLLKIVMDITCKMFWEDMVYSYMVTSDAVCL